MERNSNRFRHSHRHFPTRYNRLCRQIHRHVCHKNGGFSTLPNTIYRRKDGFSVFLTVYSAWKWKHSVFPDVLTLIMFLLHPSQTVVTPRFRGETAKSTVFDGFQAVNPPSTEIHCPVTVEDPIIHSTVWAISSTDENLPKGTFSFNIGARPPTRL